MSRENGNNRKLNKMQSIFLIWSTILNQSQSALTVFDNTYELLHKLGITDQFDLIYTSLSYDKIYTFMTEGKSLHRFPRKMSNYLYSSIQLINTSFNGNPQKVFEKNTNIRKNLMLFQGIGDHKAYVTEQIIDIYTSATPALDIDKICDGCISVADTINKEFCYLDKLSKGESDYGQ